MEEDKRGRRVYLDGEHMDESKGRREHEEDVEGTRHELGGKDDRGV